MCTPAWCSTYKRWQQAPVSREHLHCMRSARHLLSKYHAHIRVSIRLTQRTLQPERHRLRLVSSSFQMVWSQYVWSWKHTPVISTDQNCPIVRMTGFSSCTAEMDCKHCSRRQPPSSASFVHACRGAPRGECAQSSWN
jgi:hypothetical protein